MDDVSIDAAGQVACTWRRLSSSRELAWPVRANVSEALATISRLQGDPEWQIVVVVVVVVVVVCELPLCKMGVWPARVRAT